MLDISGKVSPVITMLFVAALAAIAYFAMPNNILNFILPLTFGAGVGAVATTFLVGYNPQRILMGAVIGGIAVIAVGVQSGAI